jgi:hypothetical protein
MGALQAQSKAQKNAIGGAGIGGLGTVQQAGITTSGAALDLTRWAGREVIIHVSAQTRFRWSATSSPTSISATDATSAAAPEATGGGVLYAGMPNFRDVPIIQAPASGEGVFLIIDPASSTVDVVIEASG